MGYMVRESFAEGETMLLPSFCRWDTKVSSPLGLWWWWKTMCWCPGIVRLSVEEQQLVVEDCSYERPK